MFISEGIKKHTLIKLGVAQEQHKHVKRNLKATRYTYPLNFNGASFPLTGHFPGLNMLHVGTGSLLDSGQDSPNEEKMSCERKGGERNTPK